MSWRSLEAVVIYGCILSFFSKAHLCQSHLRKRSDKSWEICPNIAGAFRERSDLELQEIRCQSIATRWEWKFHLFEVYLLSTENLDVLLNIMKLCTTLVSYLLKRLSIPSLSILYANKKSQQQESSHFGRLLPNPPILNPNLHHLTSSPDLFFQGGARICCEFGAWWSKVPTNGPAGRGYGQFPV